MINPVLKIVQLPMSFWRDIVPRSKEERQRDYLTLEYSIHRIIGLLIVHSIFPCKGEGGQKPLRYILLWKLIVTKTKGYKKMDK